MAAKKKYSGGGNSHARRIVRRARERGAAVAVKYSFVLDCGPLQAALEGLARIFDQVCAIIRAWSVDPSVLTDVSQHVAPALGYTSYGRQLPARCPA